METSGTGCGGFFSCSGSSLGTGLSASKSRISLSSASRSSSVSTGFSAGTPSCGAAVSSPSGFFVSWAGAAGTVSPIWTSVCSAWGMTGMAGAPSSAAWDKVSRSFRVSHWVLALSSTGAWSASAPGAKTGISWLSPGVGSVFTTGPSAETGAWTKAAGSVSTRGGSAKPKVSGTVTSSKTGPASTVGTSTCAGASAGAFCASTVSAAARAASRANRSRSRFRAAALASRSARWAAFSSSVISLVFFRAPCRRTGSFLRMGSFPTCSFCPESLGACAFSICSLGMAGSLLPVSRGPFSRSGRSACALSSST